MVQVWGKYMMSRYLDPSGTSNEIESKLLKGGYIGDLGCRVEGLKSLRGVI